LNIFVIKISVKFLKIIKKTLIILYVKMLKIPSKIQKKICEGK